MNTVPVYSYKRQDKFRNKFCVSDNVIYIVWYIANIDWRGLTFSVMFVYCRLKAYCIDILGRKINLSGIRPAKRSRSGANSVYVDMSRGDNVQVILGVIGPFWPKWGLGRVPRSPSFFCLVNHSTFRQLRNLRFSPNLVTKRSSVFRRWIRKTNSKVFTLGVICPKIWNRN